MIERLKEAVKDYRYLLDRGYDKEASLRFIGDSHNLSREERLALFRCVYSSHESINHREKIVSPSEVYGRVLAVDGFNVLITIESLLAHRTIIECDDGFIRDLSLIFSKYKVSDVTDKAIKMLLDFVKECKPSSVYIFFDSPISHSGDLSAKIRAMLKKAGLRGDAKAVPQADVEVVKTGEIVSSSDCVVIDKAVKVLDIAGELARKMAFEKIMKL